MGRITALFGVLTLALSIQSFGYADSKEAYALLQAKVSATISENRQFYSCESDFGDQSIYYQGKQPNKWYLINIAGVTTPRANSNLVNEITAVTADNVHFQTVYEKVHATPEGNYLLPTASRAGTETTTYVFSANLSDKPSIQHSYKQGYFGYYTFLAKGKCSVVSAEQFSEHMSKRVGI